MITVTIDNQNYRLAFHHTYQDIVLPNKDGSFTDVRIPVETVARFYKEDEPEYALEGLAKLHPADNPDKAIGRRIALTRLLEKLDREHRKVVGHAVNKSGTKLR